MPKIDLIAFDADDTLWHNETIYTHAQERFTEILAEYHSREWIDQRLYQKETANLQHYGFGIKSFILSMIETAIELTDGRIPGSEIQRIINLGKEMLNAEICPLEGVRDTVAALSQSYPLMILTKGDPLDQEAKIARSGLGEYFQHVEIVAEKARENYQSILARYRLNPEHFMMVGNSLKSDILPVVELQGIAVYVPYSSTWAYEATVTTGEKPSGYYEIERIDQLPELIEHIQNK